MDIAEKLRRYSKVSPSGCWEWQRSRSKGGYGQISIGHQKQAYAHRVSYEIHKGPIPAGLYVRHSCDSPPCCNPEHLSVGTQKDNMHDCKMRGRIVPPPVQKGATNCKTKLSPSDIEFIVNSKLSPRELADMFNVTDSAIRWRRKQWQAIQEKASKK